MPEAEKDQAPRSLNADNDVAWPDEIPQDGERYGQVVGDVADVAPQTSQNATNELKDASGEDAVAKEETDEVEGSPPQLFVGLEQSYGEVALEKRKELAGNDHKVQSVDFEERMLAEKEGESSQTRGEEALFDSTEYLAKEEMDELGDSAQQWASLDASNEEFSGEKVYEGLDMELSSRAGKNSPFDYSQDVYNEETGKCKGLQQEQPPALGMVDVKNISREISKEETDEADNFGIESSDELHREDLGGEFAQQNQISLSLDSLSELPKEEFDEGENIGIAPKMEGPSTFDSFKGVCKAEMDVFSDFEQEKPTDMVDNSLDELSKEMTDEADKIGISLRDEECAIVALAEEVCKEETDELGDFQQERSTLKVVDLTSEASKAEMDESDGFGKEGANANFSSSEEAKEEEMEEFGVFEQEKPKSMDFSSLNELPKEEFDECDEKGIVSHNEVQSNFGTAKESCKEEINEFGDFEVGQQSTEIVKEETREGNDIVASHEEVRTTFGSLEEVCKEEMDEFGDFEQEQPAIAIREFDNSTSDISKEETDEADEIGIASCEESPSALNFSEKLHKEEADGFGDSEQEKPKSVGFNSLDDLSKEELDEYDETGIAYNARQSTFGTANESCKEEIDEFGDFEVEQQSTEIVKEVTCELNDIVESHEEVRATFGSLEEVCKEEMDEFGDFEQEQPAIAMREFDNITSDISKVEADEADEIERASREDSPSALSYSEKSHKVKADGFGDFEQEEPLNAEFNSLDGLSKEEFDEGEERKIFTHDEVRASLPISEKVCEDEVEEFGDFEKEHQPSEMDPNMGMIEPSIDETRETGDMEGANEVVHSIVGSLEEVCKEETDEFGDFKQDQPARAAADLDNSTSDISKEETDEADEIDVSSRKESSVALISSEEVREEESYEFEHEKPLNVDLNSLNELPKEEFDDCDDKGKNSHDELEATLVTAEELCKEETDDFGDFDQTSENYLADFGSEMSKGEVLGADNIKNEVEFTSDLLQQDEIKDEMEGLGNEELVTDVQTDVEERDMSTSTLLQEFSKEETDEFGDFNNIKMDGGQDSTQGRVHEKEIELKDPFQSDEVTGLDPKLSNELEDLRHEVQNDATEIERTLGHVQNEETFAFDEEQVAIQLTGVHDGLYSENVYTEEKPHEGAKFVDGESAQESLVTQGISEVEMKSQSSIEDEAGDPELTSPDMPVSEIEGDEEFGEFNEVDNSGARNQITQRESNLGDHGSSPAEEPKNEIVGADESLAHLENNDSLAAEQDGEEEVKGTELRKVDIDDDNEDDDFGDFGSFEQSEMKPDVKSAAVGHIDEEDFGFDDDEDFGGFEGFDETGTKQKLNEPPQAQDSPPSSQDVHNQTLPNQQQQDQILGFLSLPLSTIQSAAVKVFSGLEQLDLSSDHENSLQEVGVSTFRDLLSSDPQVNNPLFGPSKCTICKSAVRFVSRFCLVCGADIVGSTHVRPGHFQSSQQLLVNQMHDSQVQRPRTALESKLLSQSTTSIATLLGSSNFNSAVKEDSASVALQNLTNQKNSIHSANSSPGLDASAESVDLGTDAFDALNDISSKPDTTFLEEEENNLPSESLRRATSQSLDDDDDAFDDMEGGDASTISDDLSGDVDSDQEEENDIANPGSTSVAEGAAQSTQALSSKQDEVDDFGDFEGADSSDTILSVVTPTIHSSLSIEEPILLQPQTQPVEANQTIEMLSDWFSATPDKDTEIENREASDKIFLSTSESSSTPAVPSINQNPLLTSLKGKGELSESSRAFLREICSSTYSSLETSGQASPLPDLSFMLAKGLSFPLQPITSKFPAQRQSESSDDPFLLL